MSDSHLGDPFGPPAFLEWERTTENGVVFLRAVWKTERPMPHAHCPECLGAIGTHRTTCSLRRGPDGESGMVGS